MKKLIALILVTCMLSFVLVACDIDVEDLYGDQQSALPGGIQQSGSSDEGQQSESPKDSQQSTATEVPVPTQKETSGAFGEVGNKWQGISFEDEELTILIRDDNKVKREWTVEEDGGGELAYQIELRNEVVARDLGLNVNFVAVGSGSYSDWVNVSLPCICQDIDVKLHEFDAVANYGFVSMVHVVRDYYANLLDKDVFPYFDFKLHCWNQDIVNNGTVNGQLYLAAGSMNLSMLDSAMMIWHNADLYDRIKLDTDPENIQNLVLEGYWIYAELYKWAHYWDVDATNNCESGIYGVYIGGDPFPIQPNDAIPYAWDISFFTKNNDGTFSYNFIGNERAENAKTRLKNIHDARGNGHYSDVACTCGDHFVNGGTLFYADVLYWNKESNDMIREMKDRYSVLPWPKYDEYQEYYMTTTMDYFNTVSVLNHSDSFVPTKGEAISAYLQCSNEYSFENIIGHYFSEIVTPKYFGVDDNDGYLLRSLTICHLILGNIKYDFGTVHQTVLQNVVSRVWRNNISTETTIEDVFKAHKEEFNDNLHDLYRWFGLE